MNEAITVAFITAAATIIVQIIVSLTTRAEVKKGQAVFNAVTEEKFKNIEDKFDTVNKKLELHNGYAEKFPRIEAKLELLEGGINEVRAKLG
mgnify:FL=1|nr:MAG TPA_asm: hypothetical protein [Caudoviricetes sp.]